VTFQATPAGRRLRSTFTLHLIINKRPSSRDDHCVVHLQFHVNALARVHDVGSHPLQRACDVPRFVPYSTSTLQPCAALVRLGTRADWRVASTCLVSAQVQFTQSTVNLGLALATVINGSTNDLLLQLQAPSSVGWAGVAIGSQMRNSLFFIIYPDSANNGT